MGEWRVGLQWRAGGREDTATAALIATHPPLYAPSIPCFYPTHVTNMAGVAANATHTILSHPLPIQP